MTPLHIESTKTTPEISLEPSKLSFVGKSYPENTFEFYAKVKEWIDEYFSGSPTDPTEVHFEIIYFNSSSSKLFFDLFDVFESNNENVQINIAWCYDPENSSAMEAGEDFIEDFPDLNIKLKEKAV